MEERRTFDLEADDSLLRSYLLNELGEVGRSRLEERFFEEDELFERLLLVEDALIEEYSNGELDPSEKRRFEQVLALSRRRRNAVDLSQWLFNRSQRRNPIQSEGRTSSWWRRLRERLGSMER